jgi:hypothetical protein
VYGAPGRRDGLFERANTSAARTVLAKAMPLGYLFSPMKAWLGLACALTACSGPPARAPNPTRPLDERRAVELIIQAFREEKDRPVPGTTVALTESKQIHVDVGAAERKYGVAYVTAAERLELGSALPEKDPSMGDALQLVSGLGEDGDARVLVLRDSDYQYDDHVGDEHEQPSVTAELKLKRDVHDFLVRAHAEKWP